MKRSITLKVRLVLLTLSATAILSQDKPEIAAQKSAENWLTLIDAGEYDKSWDEAATLFKAAVTKEQWAAAVGNAREQMGKLKLRKFARADYTKNLPNVPAGEYVVIQYDASFEKAATAVETITPMREKDGSWRVSGYYVKPKQ